MHVARALITTTALLVLGVACGDSDETATTSTAGPVTTIAPTKTVPATTTTGLTTTTTTDTATTVAVTTTVTPAPQQPAVWPAAEVVLATPEEAAAGFVREVLGVEPVLGDFEQGDARSGEITVFSPGEAGNPVPRGLLFLRQLGPADGWFVIGAGSDLASITSPATGDLVANGPLTIEGIGTGFEATLVVRAFASGDPTTVFDQQVVMAGNFGEPLPFSTTLDLSGATPGQVVVLLVQGGVGLETDPGDFSAVPVVVRGG
ncbi:MAG: Gmad2 immunoglobulin-like domain-containing protein [Ilumatobacteraceae bacterium]